MSTDKPHHIIAIGASAGSMEEINTFFDHTPLDGVSYVIVQHLSATFKSRMVELLSKHSKLKVKEATEGMAVKSNQVYLIPNDKFMTIRDQHLHLWDKENLQGPHLTINTFFTSLAADSGTKAIGVVLSGMGSDGSEGIRAIKKSGGMVIARNPDTSEFGSMPSSAVATGMVDLILEPQLMPAAIEDYVTQELELLVDMQKEQKYVTAIIGLIHEQLPLDFSEYKQTTILRRIKGRAVHNNYAGLDRYVDFLNDNPGEVEALAKDFLISVTAFFRDQQAFDLIESDVLPNIMGNILPGDELRMWVAGCATGEEAYSLAILVCEQLTGKFKDLVVKIFATDLDAAALSHAGKGVYSESTLKDMSSKRLEKHFVKEGSNYKVKPDIRKMVIFAQHDLVKNPPYCNIDFISCRNLLIYMTSALQKKIFLTLLFGLKRNGYLFLGSSENPTPIIQSLEVVNGKWKLYKNIQTKREVSFNAFATPDFIDAKRKHVVLSQQHTSQTLSANLPETIINSISKTQGYLAICVDENDQVVKSYGDTTKYLFQKIFTLKLTELLSPPLLVAFKTLSANVLKTGEEVSANGIKIKHGGLVSKVSMTVAPLVVNGQRLKLVTLNEQQKTAGRQEEVFDEKVYHDQYTQNLEQEIAGLKDQLATAKEKLDATNENMQSFNEELLSANEEMQSTNEEMQSVNEELHTINSDYHLKNKELIELNDDLNNYFRSNINGQLFINNKLRLMKFSPGTVKLINLQDTDIGRPISNISTNFIFETIAEDINLVLSEGKTISKEIETRDNKWFQVMTMPYIRQTDESTNGAIITFNDITELKNMQQQLDKKNQSLTRINADLDNFVHTASHDLLAPLGNIESSIGMMNEIQITDPNLSQFLSIIDFSVKKFRALIQDIAAIAKIENNMIDTEQVDLEEVIKNIEWSLADKIKAENVVINRELIVSHVLFSKKNLRSILYNLVSNGIKYNSHLTPVILIRTAREAGHVMLSVQDNGNGMEKRDVDKIFLKYGRLQTDVEGQGIGLYLAKKIVDAAGGNIIVESEPGKGSKFILELNEQQNE